MSHPETTPEAPVRPMISRTPAGLLAAALLLAMGCSGASGDDSAGDDTTGDESGAAEGQRFPDVVDVEVEPADDGTYQFAVTISSPYDTPERYADGWRIVGPDGTVYGVHELAHDHANEQPFTRTQSGVRIPEGVDDVVVEGRDLVNGYGGETLTVDLPGGP